MRQIVRQAIQRGWTELRASNGGHHILKWTDGQQIALGSTLSDHRGFKNAIALMHRIERGPIDKDKS